MNPCKNCVDTNSKCTSCNNGDFLHQNACAASCPTGFYGNNTTKICDACDSSC